MFYPIELWGRFLLILSLRESEGNRTLVLCLEGRRTSHCATLSRLLLCSVVNLIVNPTGIKPVTYALAYHYSFHYQ